LIVSCLATHLPSVVAPAGLALLLAALLAEQVERGGEVAFILGPPCRRGDAGLDG
jgi:hypothetical protein